MKSAIVYFIYISLFLVVVMMMLIITVNEVVMVMMMNLLSPQSRLGVLAPPGAA